MSPVKMSFRGREMTLDTPPASGQLGRSHRPECVCGNDHAGAFEMLN